MLVSRDGIPMLFPNDISNTFAARGYDIFPKIRKHAFPIRIKVVWNLQPKRAPQIPLELSELLDTIIKISEVSSVGESLSLVIQTYCTPKAL